MTAGLLERSRLLGGDLARFTSMHAVWDPMLVWDGRRYLMYVLTMARDRALDQGSFFARENTIHAFESADLKTWRHRGQAIGPRAEQERLCAGSVLFHEQRYWFFGSATVEQCDEWHLDQRLFLAVSEDGIDFREVPVIGLEPDAALYPHARFHPENGHMLFAWRDPWPVIDKATGEVRVFICTGGERWGCAPNVALAIADDIRGPYRLLGGVLDLPGGVGSPAIGEVERVSVVPGPAGYALTFSCWRRLVDEDRIGRPLERRLPLSDSSLYVASCATLDGPFDLSERAAATVKGSHKTGWYGTTFFELPDRGWGVLGWDFLNFRIDPANTGWLSWSAGTPMASNALALQWPLRQRLSRLFRPGYRRLLRSLAGLHRRLTCANPRRLRANVE